MAIQYVFYHPNASFTATAISCFDPRYGQVVWIEAKRLAKLRRESGVSTVSRITLRS